MTELPHETEFRPSVLKDALRHHPWMLALLTVLLAVAGAGIAYAFPGARESTAVVLVNPLYGNPFSTQGQGDQLTNLETEAQLVATDAVGTIAAKKLGLTVSATELARTANGSVTTNTQVIKVTYASNDAKTAQVRAQAFAESYLAYRQLRAKSLVDTQLKLLQQQEKNTRDQLAKATRELAAQSEGSAARALAVEQVRTYTAELTRLTSATAEQAAIPLDPGQVISPASLPSDDQLTLALLFGLAGAAVGFAIGVLSAITRERLDDRVRDVSDLDRLSVAWLGSLRARASWSFAQGEVGEDQRRMRTAVMAALPKVPAVLVVARPDGLAVAPTTVRRLAVALARSSVSVCIVDTVTPDAPERVVLSDDDNAGLAGVLLYNVPIQDVVENAMRDLAIVPSGRWTGVVSDLLGNTRMRGAVQWLRDNYDIVLISAPSLQTADGQMLARLGDGVLLESTVLHTTNADVLQAVDQLARANVRVLGSVLVTAATSQRLFRRVRRSGSASTVPVTAPATVAAATAAASAEASASFAAGAGLGGRDGQPHALLTGQALPLNGSDGEMSGYTSGGTRNGVSLLGLASQDADERTVLADEDDADEYTPDLADDDWDAGPSGTGRAAWQSDEEVRSDDTLAFGLTVTSQAQEAEDAESR